MSKKAETGGQTHAVGELLQTSRRRLWVSGSESLTQPEPTIPSVCVRVSTFTLKTQSETAWLVLEASQQLQINSSYGSLRYFRGLRSYERENS